MENLDNLYMSRCLQLAKLAAGFVAPNPMVGAVLVYQNLIIGEGYHQVFGKAHAEVNCIRSVSEEQKHLIPLSTLYVSLEPCSFVGKTPACSQLIIDHQIPEVVIATPDPHSKVAGKGIEALKAAGIQVRIGVLASEAMALNKHFFCFHQSHRPFIHLKWAQTLDGKIAHSDFSPMKISHRLTDILVHKMRATHMAILVGVNTVLKDDPLLSTRHWPGKNPVRILIDKTLQIPAQNKVMDDTAQKYIFNFEKDQESNHIRYIRLNRVDPLYRQVVAQLYLLGINSVLVEGGAHTLQSFIDAGLWDEASVITNTELQARQGIAAPILKQARLLETENIYTDQVANYIHDEQA